MKRESKAIKRMFNKMKMLSLIGQRTKFPQQKTFVVKLRRKFIFSTFSINFKMLTWKQNSCLTHTRKKHCQMKVKTWKFFTSFAHDSHMKWNTKDSSACSWNVPLAKRNSSTESKKIIFTFLSSRFIWFCFCSEQNLNHQRKLCLHIFLLLNGMGQSRRDGERKKASWDDCTHNKRGFNAYAFEWCKRDAWSLLMRLKLTSICRQLHGSLISVNLSSCWVMNNEQCCFAYINDIDWQLRNFWSCFLPAALKC